MYVARGGRFGSSNIKSVIKEGSGQYHQQGETDTVKHFAIGYSLERKNHESLNLQ